MAAGAFAAIVPAFGSHIALALGAALLARGSLAAAAAACMLVGDPLAQAVELPLAYGVGRWLLPFGHPGPAWLPAWTRAFLSVAEGALAGGALLGVALASPAFFSVRRAIAARIGNGDPDGVLRGAPGETRGRGDGGGACWRAVCKAAPGIRRSPPGSRP